MLRCIIEVVTKDEWMVLIKNIFNDIPKEVS